MKKNQSLSLINQILEEKSIKTLRCPFWANHNLAEKLSKCSKKEGSKIVDQILSELYIRKAEGKLLFDSSREDNNANGSPLFHLIYTVIRIFAEPKHARQLREIFLWDEIALVKSPTLQWHLLNVLKKIDNHPPCCLSEKE